MIIILKWFRILLLLRSFTYIGNWSWSNISSCFDRWSNWFIELIRMLLLFPPWWIDIFQMFIWFILKIVFIFLNIFSFLLWLHFWIFHIHIFWSENVKIFKCLCKCYIGLMNRWFFCISLFSTWLNRLIQIVFLFHNNLMIDRIRNRQRIGIWINRSWYNL